MNVRDAVAAVGAHAGEGEDLCLVKIINGAAANATLAECADAEVNGDLYLASGTFRAGTIQRWQGRSSENLAAVMWLPFDMDLADHMRFSDESEKRAAELVELRALDDAALWSLIEKLRTDAEEIFRIAQVPIHRLDYTGYGLAAYTYVHGEDRQRVAEIRQVHKTIVARINRLAGFPLCDPQVSDAGTRIMRLPPCDNTKGPIARQARTLFYIEGAVRLETIPDEPQAPPRVVIPEHGKALEETALHSIVEAVRPSWSSGYRHALALGLAGMFAKAGIPEAQAEAAVLALSDGDEEARDRVRAVRTSYDRVRSGMIASGFTRLRELLPPDVLLFVDDTLREVVRSQAATATLSATGAPPASAIHLTDLGNARRLVRQHGQDIRYCHLWSKWLVWDGTRWAIDESGAIFRRTKETVAAIYAEASVVADETGRKALAKHALASESDARIKAMVSQAESEPGIPITPDDLDQAPLLLNCRNGTLDLRTGALRPHERANFLTKLAPVAYDAAATCPRWLAFLDQIMAGKRGLIDFLQCVAGYALTGETVERAMFVLWGLGRNGKSTFLETLMAVLGEDYASRMNTDLILARRDSGIPNDLAKLKGVRFAFASEAEEGRRLAEATVKDLTGGDTVTARMMRSEWFTFRPEFKLFLGTNHKPPIRGSDQAIWDRIRLIPFNVRIPDADVDRHLKAKLAAEAPGILAWAVQGCLRWQAHGLPTPQEVGEATDIYRQEMDVLGAFFADRCVVAPSARCTASAIYAAFTKWCEETGEKPTSQKFLGQRLVERGHTPTKITGGVRAWIGIGLADEPTQTGFTSDGKPA